MVFKIWNIKHPVEKHWMLIKQIGHHTVLIVEIKQKS